MAHFDQRQREDPATEALSHLLNDHRKILSLFLEFLGGQSLVNEFGTSPDVTPQFRIPGGRIDLLIHAGHKAVIIEAKVKDGQKVYQLEKYYAYWEKEHGRPPKVFWLTRRYVEDLWGVEQCMTGRKTWNDLHDFLQAALPRLSKLEAQSVRDFLDHLNSAAIILPDGESAVIKRREKGLSRERAYSILSGIGSSFSDSPWIVDEQNELPYRLLIGRKKWKLEFADTLPLKVRIFLQQSADCPIGFFIWPRICLYHWQDYQNGAHDAIKQTHFGARFDQWISVCLKAGLVPMRNGKKHARRAANIPMPQPYQFDPQIRVLLAEEPEDVSKRLSQFTADDDAIVKNGIERVGKYLDIVDRFQR
jgi:hypothetical protein